MRLPACSVSHKNCVKIVSSEPILCDHIDDMMGLRHILMPALYMSGLSSFAETNIDRISFGWDMLLDMFSACIYARFQETAYQSEEGLIIASALLIYGICILYGGIPSFCFLSV